MENKTLKIGIDIRSKNSHFKATYAIRELRRQLFKHLKTNDFKVDNSVNEHFWAKGKGNTPTSVELSITKDANKYLVSMPNVAPKAPKEKKVKEPKKVAAEEKSAEAPKKTQKKAVKAKKE